ncbi:hypothetical protein [Ralstonia pseudosolanacearum]|uniref:hypothetical protein n=1 Tax=Ralstonia pseudosolanacearum TaxID=1310165 RepID=UPI003863D38D
MITNWAQNTVDRAFVEQIEIAAQGNADYWAFRKAAHRDGVHGLIQYPAMMIPTMQAKLLSIARQVHGNVQRVLDPFVGGGTMLTEVMEQGLDFTGLDINPLAILACKVKAGPYPVADLSAKVRDLLANIAADRGLKYEVNFSGQSKWFTKGASIGLSRIHRAISSVDYLWLRQFFWLSMAETIRRSSNSRTSTYKLHIRPEEECNASAEYVISVFADVVTSNAKKIHEQQRQFAEREVLGEDGYKGRVGVKFQDALHFEEAGDDEKFDLLFTSPPYGDNTTTIPYGQFSYLALNWIPLSDIDPLIPKDVNRNTHAIDSASMGGSLRDAEEKSSKITPVSRAFESFLQELGGAQTSYGKRLTSFCFDLHRCVESLAKQMAPNGYMVWTLGNRSLDGKRVPLDKIVWDFLEHTEMRRVSQFVRPIPSKRMPTRNSCSDTMDTEIVLIAGA